MVIHSVELNNFRNYDSLKLELDPGVNIFYGNNAQGKTNILDAVYVDALQNLTNCPRTGN